MNLKKIAIALTLCLSTNMYCSELQDDKQQARKSLYQMEVNTKQDKWWNEFELSKKEISQYVKELADRDLFATTWFLMGGKYGFSSTPATKEQMDNLISASDKIVTAVCKHNLRKGDNIGDLLYGIKPHHASGAFFMGYIFQQMKQTFDDVEFFSLAGKDKFLFFLSDSSNPARQKRALKFYEVTME